MSYSKRDAVKLANSLLRQNRSGLITWRDLEFLTGVKAGTLNRIAKSHGKWLPKDEEILKKLKLIKEPSPYRMLPKWFERTPEALSFFNGQRAKVKQMSANTRNEVKKGVR